MPEDDPDRWPSLMSDATAAQYLDIARSTFRKLVARGDVPRPITIPGVRSSRWRREDLDQAAERWGAKR